MMMALMTRGVYRLCLYMSDDGVQQVHLLACSPAALITQSTAAHLLQSSCHYTSGLLTMRNCDISCNCWVCTETATR